MKLGDCGTRPDCLGKEWKPIQELCPDDMVVGDELEEEACLKEMDSPR